MCLCSNVALSGVRGRLNVLVCVFGSCLMISCVRSWVLFDGVFVLFCFVLGRLLRAYFFLP